MSKITDFTAMGAVSPSDLLVAVDVSDTSMAATGTNKKMTLAQAGFPQVVPSGDTTGATDTANLQAAINATAAGAVLQLSAGTFYTSAPLTCAKRIVIKGADAGFGWGIYASGYPGNSQFETAAQTGTIIQATAGWAQGGAAGAALLLLTTDATHYITEGPVIRDICLSGTTGTGSGGFNMTATADGIRAIGAVANVILDNVMCMYVRGWGLACVYDPSAPGGFTIQTPGTWRVSRLCIFACGAGVTEDYVDDSRWSDCLVIGCQGNGWRMQGGANASYTNCRAEWNGANGFWLTGAWNAGAGVCAGVTFTACSTDANTGHGMLIDATVGDVACLIQGAFFRRDSNTSGGGTAAALAITQTAASNLHFRVFVRNFMVIATTAGFASIGPHFGLAVNGTGVWLDIDGAYLIGNTAAVSITGTPANLHFGPGCAYFTGGSNSPSGTAAQGSSAPGDWTVSGSTFLSTASIFGIASHNAGTSTSGSAPLLTPAFANGTPAQLSDTTRDYMVYLQIGTAGTALAISIGPTSGVADAIVAGAAAASGALYAVRLPAGWFLKWSATTATLASQKAIGC